MWFVRSFQRTVSRYPVQPDGRGSWQMSLVRTEAGHAQNEPPDRPGGASTGNCSFPSRPRTTECESVGKNWNGHFAWLHWLSYLLQGKADLWSRMRINIFPSHPRTTECESMGKTQGHFAWLHWLSNLRQWKQKGRPLVLDEDQHLSLPIASC